MKRGMGRVASAAVAAERTQLSGDGLLVPKKGAAAILYVVG